MPRAPRSVQINLEATSYYHCIARCVRRAFLCGNDPYTGESFDHRKPWFLERMKLAAEVFAIDICAYAVLSNHCHFVLRVDRERVDGWTDEAVLRRYAKFFPNAARAVRDMPKREQGARLVEIRERLSSISWFMRVICEHVARRANREDEVTGRFWEGRFKSQALLDTAALYTCMSYVDLNPVRAGLASSLESSDFTSIKQRLGEAAAKRARRQPDHDRAAVPLAPLRGEARTDAGKRRVLDFRFDDYVELLNWTGRAKRAKPGGKIRGAPPVILSMIGAEPTAWLGAMDGEELMAATSLGDETRMAAEAERRECRWLRGKRTARRLFGRAS